MGQENDKPRLIEVSISASAGGKVEIIPYAKITSEYHLSISRRYEVPEGWSAEEAEAFQQEEYLRIREGVDNLAQAEYDERFSQSHLNQGS